MSASAAAKDAERHVTEKEDGLVVQVNGNDDGKTIPDTELDLRDAYAKETEGQVLRGCPTQGCREICRGELCELCTLREEVVQGIPPKDPIPESNEPQEPSVVEEDEEEYHDIEQTLADME